MNIDSVCRLSDICKYDTLSPRKDISCEFNSVKQRLFEADVNVILGK